MTDAQEITAAEYFKLTKGNKYGSKQETIGIFHFDSRAEAKRWRDLELLQAAGAISGLTHHPRYPLVCNGVLVCVYEADAAYHDHAYAPARWTVEDCKGAKTAAYIIKAKLFQAVMGYPIREVQAWR